MQLLMTKGLDSQQGSLVHNVRRPVHGTCAGMRAGKIVQSTVDECRDVYATWIALAHEVLRQKNLEKEEVTHVVTSSQPKESSEHVEKLDETSNEVRSQMPPLNQQAADSLQGSCSSTLSVISLCRGFILKCSSSLKSQSQASILIVITIAVILLLMQMSILVLLGRPQHVHVIRQGDCASSMYQLGETGVDTLSFLDRKINHLKDEMLMVEVLLDKMKQEYTLLETKLKEFEHLRKLQTA
ncbi:hypothetical protein CQW23_02636 [Capsicum baccatum]|uniref:Uncharacterized protein n=1 Tax=Capsicum baccatum TaxID=33114 RepID=A0A2G2XS10_CAPBA|nr:hypothetical protein CQW23_02636 [Capsicum baccatum]